MDLPKWKSKSALGVKERVEGWGSVSCHKRGGPHKGSLGGGEGAVGGGEGAWGGGEGDGAVGEE